MKNAVKATWILIFLIGAAAAQIDEIESGLSCPCGCAMTVATCMGAMACSAATKIDAEVRTLIKQGMTKEQIYASLMKTHGEQILAAPTKKGFNLLAWVLPFFAIIAFGLILVIQLNRWAKNKEDSRPTKTQNQLDPEYEQQLDEQLKKFKSRS